MRGLNLHPGASPTRIVKGPDGKLTVHADVKDGEPLVLEVRLVACTLCEIRTCRISRVHVGLPSVVGAWARDAPGSYITAVVHYI